MFYVAIFLYLYFTIIAFKSKDYFTCIFMGMPQYCKLKDVIRQIFYFQIQHIICAYRVG